MFHTYGWMWGFAWLWWLFVLAVLVVVIAFIVRAAGGGPPPARSSEPTPQDILRRRYASGEISTDEFKERMAVLEGRR